MSKQCIYCPDFPGVRQLIPNFRAKLCKSGEFPKGIDQKGHNVAVGAVPMQGILGLEGCFVGYANPTVPSTKANEELEMQM